MNTMPEGCLREWTWIKLRSFKVIYEGYVDFRKKSVVCGFKYNIGVAFKNQNQAPGFEEWERIPSFHKLKTRQFM